MEVSIVWPGEICDIEGCIAYLKDWLLSHPLEMRIIAIHRPPAPAGDGSMALQFMGHHGFLSFFLTSGMEGQVGSEQDKYAECTWVKSTKIVGKSPSAKDRNAGGRVSNLTRWMYFVCYIDYNSKHASG
jgi:hypothetical protein